MISETLLALGPYVVPALILLFAALLWLALWLLEEPAPFRDHEGNVVGTRPRRNPWRVGLACLILAGLALQLAPLVLP